MCFKLTRGRERVRSDIRFLELMEQSLLWALPSAPHSQSQSLISHYLTSPDSNKSLTGMASSDSESGISCSVLLSGWGSLFSRLLLKGPSLWLDKRYVLYQHSLAVSTAL